MSNSEPGGGGGGMTAEEERAAEGGWQPIETAPKDGSTILYSAGGWVCAGCWHIREEQWREHNNFPSDSWGTEDYPTHWMPLPSPPA